MREIEFLPNWYPVFRRRRGLAVTQAWATAVLLATTCLFGVAAHHQVMAHEAAGRVVQGELRQTRSQLKLLDEQLAMKKQLEQQGLVQTRVGLQIDGTRLISELTNLMTPDMALLELTAETQESARPALPVGVNNLDAAAAGTSVKSKIDPGVDRRLRVKLVGVAPTDVDIANFLAGLTNKPCFDEVAMTYAKDRIQAGHIMREFELAFLINLNAPSAE